MISHYSNSLILITFLLYFNLNVFIHHAVPVGINATEIVNQTSSIQSLSKLNSLNSTQVNSTFNLKSLANNTQLNITMLNVTFNGTSEKPLVFQLVLNSTTTKNETLIENSKQNDKSNSSNTTLEQKSKQIVDVSSKAENENLQKSTTSMAKENKSTVNGLSSKKELKNDKNQDNEKYKSEEVKEDKSKNNEENTDKEQAEDKLQEPVEPLEDDVFESEKAAKNDAKETVDNNSKKEKPNPSPSQDSQTDVFDDESSGPGFLTYFLVLSTVFILAYIAYHKKSKVIALILEGRKSTANQRRFNSNIYNRLENVQDAMPNIK